MKYLTKVHWKEFQDEQGKYNGTKFEDLVKELLVFVQPSNWIRTQQSWDGSKDFETWQGDKKIWAECKIYRENISIRTISPTLVMAINAKTDVIFFFSFSPLNNNALKHLSQYQNQTGKEIRIYDDLKLELLILKAPSLISRYFPSFKKDAKLYTLPLSAYINPSKDPDIEYTNDDLILSPIPSQIAIQRYATFCIDLFIQNYDGLKSTKVEVTVDHNKLVKGVVLLNEEVIKKGYKISFIIQPAGLHLYRFYFKAISGGKVLSLPSIIVSSKGMDTNKIPLPSIYVSSLFRTPLIGKNAFDNLTHFRQLIPLRNKAIFVTVYGRSGAGKSRLLKEFRETLFANSFHLITLDGGGGNIIPFGDFIKKIIAKLYNLPLFIQTGESIFPNANSNRESNDILMDILYAPYFKHIDEFEKCFKIFCLGIQGRKLSLIVDNAQGFDDVTISFIEKLIENYKDMPARFVGILCFNTELLFNETSAKKTYEYLKYLSAGESDQFFKYEVKDFTEQDLEVYFDHCLQGNFLDKKKAFTNLFPETFKFFIKKVLPRPLYIEQILFLLEDNQVLLRKDDVFYISNPESFHQFVSLLPTDFTDVLKLRWDLILRRLGVESKRLVEILSFFGSLKSHFPSMLGVSENVIKQLNELGIIQIGEDGYISFYHLQVFLFFRRLNRNLDGTDALLFVRFIESNHLQTEYFYQYFNAKETLGLIKDEQIYQATDMLIASPPYNEFLNSFIYSYHSTVFKSKIKPEGFKELEALRNSVILLKLYNGYQIALNTFTRLLEQITLRYKWYYKYGKEYTDFIYEYVNICIAVYEDLKAMDLLNATISSIELLQFRDEREKLRAMGYLLNRQCVIFKSFNLKDEAIKSGSHSLKIAKENDYKELQIQNEIDLANVYGRKSKYKELISKHWRNAIETFNANSSNPGIGKWKSMVKLYEAQLSILEQRWDRAETLIEDGIKYCEITNDHFFGVKFRMVKILYLFLYLKNEAHEDIIDNIHQMMDKCITHNVNRAYWKSFWLEAMINRNLGNAKTKYWEDYTIAIEQFLKIHRNQGVEDFHLRFLEEAGLNLRLNKGKIAEDNWCKINLDIQNLKSDFVRDKIAALLNDSESNNSLKLDRYRPQDFFNDGKFDFPIIG